MEEGAATCINRQTPPNHSRLNKFQCMNEEEHIGNRSYDKW